MAFGGMAVERMRILETGQDVIVQKGIRGKGCRGVVLPDETTAGRSPAESCLAAALFQE
jgi:hypothetical protein